MTRVEASRLIASLVNKHTFSCPSAPKIIANPYRKYSYVRVYFLFIDDSGVPSKIGYLSINDSLQIITDSVDDYLPHIRSLILQHLSAA